MNFSESQLGTIRKRIRAGHEMTDDMFKRFLLFLYNHYFYSRTKWHRIFQEAAEHAVEGNKRSIYMRPDGGTCMYLFLMVENTKNETLRQLRGLKVYHTLTATGLPMSWVIRIMKAYYPKKTLHVVHSNNNPNRGSMRMNQSGFVISVR